MALSQPIFRLKHQAKQNARSSGRKLHLTLDETAKREGFQSWSHLLSQYRASHHADHVASAMQCGELTLLAARPMQGKTLLALEIASLFARTGVDTIFFTLDYTARDIADRLRQLGIRPDTLNGYFHLETSEEICASYILRRLSNARPKARFVVDYVQLLDQDRSKPDLARQVDELRTGIATGCNAGLLISQIDRSFDLSSAHMPGMDDIRMPNPFDLSAFSQVHFLNNGKIDSMMSD